jgi:hypothetical protein
MRDFVYSLNTAMKLQVLEYITDDTGNPKTNMCG